MKKFVLSMLAAIAIALAGCSSASNIQNDGPQKFVLSEENYTVLGRVRIEVKKTGLATPSFFKSNQFLYYKLLDEAVKQYANTDDIINITVDEEAKKILFIKIAKYTITGLAVDYK